MAHLAPPIDWMGLPVLMRRTCRNCNVGDTIGNCIGSETANECCKEESRDTCRFAGVASGELTSWMARWQMCGELKGTFMAVGLVASPEAQRTTGREARVLPEPG